MFTLTDYPITIMEIYNKAKVNMSYIVQSSEKVKGIGADCETKALLYLMNYRDDSDEVNSFAIDFFNDVTGLSIRSEKVWDIQSKGKKNASAKEIGRELVTLFKNEMSDLNFDYLILFTQGVPKKFRKDPTKTTFCIDNIEEKSLKSLRDGLIEEANKKTYVDKNQISDNNIDNFLKKVTFVVDDKSKVEYIKGIISINPKYIPKDEILEGIFNRIRDAQSGKKNNRSVEGVTVNNIRDVFYYDRILKAKDIRLMVLNYFINQDVVKTKPPQLFFKILGAFDGISQNEIVEDCKLDIAIILNDKTCRAEFWKLLDLICDAINSNNDLTVKQTFDLISETNVVKNSRLEYYTILYLISVMKEALHDY